MNPEEKAWRALERLARRVNARNPEQALATVRKAVRTGAHRVGVKVLDRIVSKLASGPVRTLPEDVRSDTPEPTPPAEPASKESPSNEVSLPAAEPGHAAEDRSAPVLDDGPSRRVGTRPDPPRFGIDRVVLLIRRPDRAFVYWEIDETRIRDASSRLGTLGSQAELRLLDASGACVRRADVSARWGKHSFEIAPGSTEYAAELVLKADAANGRDALLLSRSTAVTLDVAR